MLKVLLTVYFVIFGLYVLFSRQPDYFDGEIIPARIISAKDMFHNKTLHLATFSLNQKPYTIRADYLMRFLHDGDKVNVIYESSNPEKAAVYSWWGYWIKWSELIASIALLLVLYFIAAAVTKHPTPEALIEELEGSKPKMKKRKYID